METGRKKANILTENGKEKVIKKIKAEGEIELTKVEEKYGTETIEKLRKEDLIFISNGKVQTTNKAKGKYCLVSEKEDLPFFSESGKFVSMWMTENLMDDYHFATHEDSEQLYIYNDGIYEPNGRIKVKRLAQKRLGQYVRNHYINETVEAVKRATYTPKEKFNNPNDGIVVQNGLLKPKERELKSHSPEYVHLTKIPWKYDPDADCPKIKEFMYEIVNDDDVKLIQELFGYCLLKNYPISKAFMFLGSGANGKSTLLDLLIEFLGAENIATPSLQDLLKDKFAKIELFGKLANIHADLSSEKLEKTGTFKMLTGGDMIYGQKKFQDPIKFKNHAKLIYSANELPKTQDRTEAFFRRWIVVDFPYHFPESDEDTNENLPYNIIDDKEMSGLLNWALDGLDRILKNGSFSQTESRKEIEEKWIMETDSLRAFLDIACKTQMEGYTAKKDFYEVYKEFCDQNNLYVTKKGQVTKRLPTLKPKVQLFRPEIDGKQVRSWKNLIIKEAFIKENNYIRHIQPLRTTLIAWRENNNNSSNNISSEKKSDMMDIDKYNKKNEISKVENLLPENNKIVEKDTFIEHISLKLDITEDRAEELIEKLDEKGIIHEPRPGKIKKL